MNLCGLNFFDQAKGERVQNQLLEIGQIFNSNKSNDFVIINKINKNDLKKYDTFILCGDVKITFNRDLIEKYLNINLTKKPRLIRDVTYLRIIPKIKNLDVNFFPRFTWNSILPGEYNFPYDQSYNRWLDIKNKYNLHIKDYKKQGDNILFFLQIPTDASLNELNFNNDGYLNFMIRTIKEIFKYSDRKIVLRSHPLSKKNDVIANFLLNYFKETKKVFLSNNDKLRDDLKDTKCVISYNSSATVEALFDGIRVINLSKMQPCFSAANNNLSDIENLKELNRDDFLRKIAFLHWETEELKSSEIKKYLCNLLEKSIPKGLDAQIV